MTILDPQVHEVTLKTWLDLGEGARFETLLIETVHDVRVEPGKESWSPIKLHIGAEVTLIIEADEATVEVL